MKKLQKINFTTSFTFITIIYLLFLAGRTVLFSQTISKKTLESYSIDELESYAVKNNPLYLAEKKNISMARGDIITAALYKNPMFYLEHQFVNGQNGYSVPIIGSLGGDSSGGPEISPKISYDFDIVGIRRSKIKLAKQAFLSNIANFADFDRLFRMRLRQNYWYYLFITSQLEVQKEFYDKYTGLLKLNQFRAAKGDISRLEYDRLELEQINLDREYQNIQLLQYNAAKNLKVLLGIEIDGYVLNFKDKLVFKPLDNLSIDKDSFNLENRPDYSLLKSKVYESRINLELKEKEGSYLPYLNLGTETRFKQGNSYIGFFAQAPLKINDRSQGEILKANAKYQKNKYQLQYKANEILSEINIAKNELIQREEKLKMYKKINLLEKNKQVQEKFRISYLSGASNLASFLEAEKNYLTVIKGYNEQVFMYYIALENYQSALGGIKINE
jgi:cobalt-zinc-cadmium efflux system outer membrane protein